MGHHLVRHGGGLHAGPRHQRDQRGPPSPAGIALRRPRGSVLGPHLVPRRQRRHHPRHGLAGGAPRAQALLPHLRRPLHRQLLPLRHRAEPAPSSSWPASSRASGADRSFPLPGHPVGDLSPRAAGPRHGGVGHRLHDGPDHRARPSAATSPTTGRGAGSSTSTCPWASSASSWPAPSSSTRRTCASPARVDWPGLTLMVLGFGCLQLLLDRGEREDWFDSTLIVSLAVLAQLRPRGLRHPRAHGPGAHPRSPGLRRPQLRHRRHLHRVHRARDVLEHAPPRRLHPEAPRLRRVDVGAGARAGRLRQHAVPAHMRPTRHANGPAAAPDLRLRGQRHQPVHDVRISP